MELQKVATRPHSQHQQHYHLSLKAHHRPQLRSLEWLQVIGTWITILHHVYHSLLQGRGVLYSDHSYGRGRN
ncbi:hypothetical protein I3842_01G239000 [Carya illinoinensis]|uniref:Uncharacterized protein n=1 Tax=Carya illinoinensis TaxID=32201 RepID=A0A922K5J5_CARIL|nr:hypothetical protein I3842_01G239000 [Carya illinoinensis]